LAVAQIQCRNAGLFHAYLQTHMRADACTHLAVLAGALSVAYALFITTMGYQLGEVLAHMSRARQTERGEIAEHRREKRNSNNGVDNGRHSA
jgi:hypothetical protein